MRIYFRHECCAKQVLHEIVTRIENLATSVDALESVLIRQGTCGAGEIQIQRTVHEATVGAHSAELRAAIDRLF